MRWIAIAALVLVPLLLSACRETVTSAPEPAPATSTTPTTTTTTTTTTADAAATPVAATDAAAAPAPATSATSCDRDDDCVVSSFAGCCACPQCQVAPPHASTRAQEKLEADKCAVVDCDMGPCNVGGMCPPGEPAAHFAARCVDHACTMARLTPP